MNTVIKHVINGGKIEDRVGDVWTLSHMVLSNDSRYEDFKLEDIMDDFIVHVTAEQKEIADLKELVARMTDEMARLREEKVIVCKPTYNHLEAGEVKEIEDMITSHPSITSTIIMKTYKTSQAVVSRIRTAVHPKSSQAYKTLLMKRDLGE